MRNKTATPYKRWIKDHGSDPAGDFDAIVIGSGIGGLTTAALLAKHQSARVVVLERHYVPGGFTHVFRRPGFEWDVGVHYIGEVNNPNNEIRRVFDHITDGELEWANMGEVYDTIVIEDRTYPFYAGRTAFRNAMVERFPNEAGAIDAYLERIRATAERSKQFFTHRALPPLLQKLTDPLLRRPALADFRITTGEVLDALTDNAELKAVLVGQFGDYGQPPAESTWLMHAIVVAHYLHGAAYPVGGSARFADTIVPVIERTGGRVLVNAEATRIVTERGRAVGVEMADGQVLRAPRIISNAGALLTYGKLLDPDVRARHGLDAKLERVKPSASHVCLYLGLDQTAAQLNLPKSNYWVYPGPDHDHNVKAFEQDPDAPLPLAYISFPGAKDPDFSRRFPGKTTIEVLTVAPYEWFEKWADTPWKKRGPEYEALKAKLIKRLLEPLYQQFPQVRGHIVHQELSSPLSTTTFTAHKRGAIYGLSPTVERFEQKWLQARTPIKGLYLTGSDIITGGVGGALMGGVVAATAVFGVRELIGLAKALKAPKSLSGHSPTPLTVTG